MQKIKLSFLFWLIPFFLLAQNDSVFISTLDSVSINAYYGKRLLHTPAAVNYISNQQLERFGNANILQAINATPGVRMEERSPGSYRLNIRGSSVRSPFGVRNVKIYYAGIPFTAPGGSSMLNMMGYYNIGSLEVIKGPGGSMYGAGTGGVLLMQPSVSKHTFSAALMGGSFGMMGANVATSFGNNTVRYEHFQSDGYRNHSAMRRDNVSWDGVLQSSSKNKLEAHLLYSNLFYETPGALTLKEFTMNARAARPATATLPGAAQAKASIHQQNILAGLVNRYKISSTLSNTTSIYGFHSYTKNPTVQNYERKMEPHFGGRSSFNGNWQSGQSLFELNSGVEFQQGNFEYKTYRNIAGKPDTLRIHDKLNIRQYFVFAQLNWNYKKWILSTGASINRMQFNFDRLNTRPPIKEDKAFKGNFIPRFAVLYKITDAVSLFANVSKGFSPPAADEIFADNNSYNLALQAEQSWNYEPGIRGSFLDRKINFDLSYFNARLSNSIVTRRDSAGGNYYVNAGKSAQKGFEGSVAYELFSNPEHYLYKSALKITYSHYNFRYSSFIQSGNNFSGNTMPGVSPNNINVLADILTSQNISLNLSYSYSGQIKLNDANTAKANAYHLLAAKLSYKKQIKKTMLSVFAGADNIGNTQYSLGNDINGFGGRYYNVAAARSFYGGIGINL